MTSQDQSCRVTRPSIEGLENRLLLSTIHYVDNNLGDGSWTGVFIDLQSALAVAADGDEIWVAAGTYNPTNTSDRSISFDMIEVATL